MNLKHLIEHKQEVYFVNVLKKKEKLYLIWRSVCGFYPIQQWLRFLLWFRSESQAGTQNFQTRTLVFRWKRRSSLFQQLVLWLSIITGQRRRVPPQNCLCLLRGTCWTHRKMKHVNIWSVIYQKDKHSQLDKKTEMLQKFRRWRRRSGGQQGWKPQTTGDKKELKTVSPKKSNHQIKRCCMLGSSAGQRWNTAERQDKHEEHGKNTGGTQEEHRRNTAGTQQEHGGGTQDTCRPLPGLWRVFPLTESRSLLLWSFRVLYFTAHIHQILFLLKKQLIQQMEAWRGVRPWHQPSTFISTTLETRWHLQDNIHLVFTDFIHLNPCFDTPPPPRPHPPPPPLIGGFLTDRTHKSKQ